ncbi:MAG: hypothetical protein GY765_28905 [bacterium]|nr:hypothetical protein [bacterium]
MKNTAFTSAMTGAFAALVIGFKWLSDLNSDMGKMARSFTKSGMGGSAGAQLASYEIATYLLIGCGIIGAVIAIMMLFKKGNPYITGGILIVAGVLPLLFVSKALFGLPMVLAGLLLIKKKRALMKLGITA